MTHDNKIYKVIPNDGRVRFIPEIEFFKENYEEDTILVEYIINNVKKIKKTVTLEEVDDWNSN